MNTALKTDDLSGSRNEESVMHSWMSTEMVPLPSPDRKEATTDKETPGRNTRRLALIFSQNTGQTDVFELFGWNDLPDSMKEVIRTDMERYRDELLGLYATSDPGVKHRRNRISFWINAYRDGICDAQTAADSMKI